MPSLAHAAPGFSGGFLPEEWVVVNTNPDQDLDLDPLTPEASFICNDGPNEVACVNNISVATGGFSLRSSIADVPGGGESTDTPRTTTLTLRNENSPFGAYWRPYRITFNWSFTGGSLASAGNEFGSQYIRIATDPGLVITDNSTSYEFVGVTGRLYNDISASVYLPPGATLNFTIFTDNADDIATFNLTGFDATEIPAPLPITGAAAFFASSRRLRSRLRNVQQRPDQDLASAGVISKVGSKPLFPSIRKIHPEEISRYSARLGLPMLASHAALASPAARPALRTPQPGDRRSSEARM